MKNGPHKPLTASEWSRLVASAGDPAVRAFHALLRLERQIDAIRRAWVALDNIDHGCDEGACCSHRAAMVEALSRGQP